MKKTKMYRTKKRISKIRNRKALILFLEVLISIGIIGYHQTQAEAEIGQITPYSVNHQENVLEYDYSPLVGTKMQEAIPYIKTASKYYGIYPGLYLGIANAESSFNRFPEGSFNPFGIKPDGIKYYSSWEQSINGFSQLIKYYYLDEGKITPEQLMPKYVGYKDEHWVRNVKKYYDPKIEVVIK